MTSNAAITSLPKDPTLTQAMVKKLRAACVARQKHADIFFQSEKFGVAQSISTDSRSLYHRSKSDILKRLEKETQPKTHGNNSALVVDSSVIVKIIGQQIFRTFKEFATNVYKHMISLGLELKAERIGIVAERYFQNSFKGGTRKDRLKKSRFDFNDETKFPNDFIDNFSKNSENKDDLNKYLAQKFLILHESDIVLVVTFNDSILSNAVLHEPHYLRKLTKRIIHHAINLAGKGYQHIQIRSADRDVIIVSIAQSEIILSKE